MTTISITFNCRVLMVHMTDDKQKSYMCRAKTPEDADLAAQRACPGWLPYRIEMLSQKFAVLAVKRQGQWFTQGAVRT